MTETQWRTIDTALAILLFLCGMVAGVSVMRIYWGLR